MNYRRIAQIFRPGKHLRVSTGMSPDQAEEYSKLVNNAYVFLRRNV